MRRDLFEARFWGRVTIGAPEECWPWTGPRDPQGYGHLKYAGEHLVHRVAYLFGVGPIPDGFHVLHSCDNPPCCNPRHLRPGTNRDNVDDKVSRGRASGLAGSANPAAILTEKEALAIRAARKAGSTQRDLARQYGVAPSTIRALLRGETWKAAA